MSMLIDYHDENFIKKIKKITPPSNKKILENLNKNPYRAIKLYSKFIESFYDAYGLHPGYSEIKGLKTLDLKELIEEKISINEYIEKNTRALEKIHKMNEIKKEEEYIDRIPNDEALIKAYLHYLDRPDLQKSVPSKLSKNMLDEKLISDFLEDDEKIFSKVYEILYKKELNEDLDFLKENEMKSNIKQLLLEYSFKKIVDKEKLTEYANYVYKTLKLFIETVEDYVKFIKVPGKRPPRVATTGNPIYEQIKNLAESVLLQTNEEYITLYKEYKNKDRELRSLIRRLKEIPIKQNNNNRERNKKEIIEDIKKLNEKIIKKKDNLTTELKNIEEKITNIKSAKATELIYFKFFFDALNFETTEIEELIKDKLFGTWNNIHGQLYTTGFFYENFEDYLSLNQINGLNPVIKHLVQKQIESIKDYVGPVAEVQETIRNQIKKANNGLVKEMLEKAQKALEFEIPEDVGCKEFNLIINYYHYKTIKNILESEKNAKEVTSSEAENMKSVLKSFNIENEELEKKILEKYEELNKNFNENYINKIIKKIEEGKLLKIDDLILLKINYDRKNLKAWKKLLGYCSVALKALGVESLESE